ncbi:MAG: hypothetical protein AAF548_00285 [Actinomycetota bacterium]
MTDFSHPDDELLSSFIDGELTGDDATRLRARLEGDAGLRTRLEQLRTAADLVATPVEALDAAPADSMIAAALAASGTSGAVTDLGAARARRTRWLPRVAAVAAGVALLALAVPALDSLDDGDTDDATTADSGVDDTADGAESDFGLSAEAGTDSAEPADDGDMADDDMADDAAFEEDVASDDMADDDSPDAMDADGDDASDGAGADPRAAPDSFEAVFGQAALGPDLCTFADEEMLREEVADRFRAANTAPQADDDDGDEDGEVTEDAERLAAFGIASCCELLNDVESSIESFAAVDYANAVVADELVTVALYGLPNGDARAVVIDPVACDVRDEVPIDGAG